MRNTQTYYVTFGQKYRHENDALGRHPDGWMEVTATTMEEARSIVFTKLDRGWAFIYAGRTFDKSLYPKGCIKELN